MVPVIPHLSILDHRNGSLGFTMKKWEMIADARRQGFSLVELLVSIGVISLLLAIAMPAVQHSREAARATICRNHLRQLGIAIHEHESAKQAYPLTRTHWATDPITPGRSLHVELLPYLDFATAYHKVDFDEIYSDYESAPTAFVASNQELLSVTVPVFLCPSDRQRVGACNYRCSMGTAESIEIADGFFVNNVVTRPADITDGLSNTVMMGERVLGSFSPTVDYWRDILLVRGGIPSNDADGWTEGCTDAALTASYVGSDNYSGGTWLRGGWRNTWYHHGFPPNHSVPDCAFAGPNSGGGSGQYSARSYHSQTVNVVFGDGAVRAISQNIAVPLWRALATRSGGENVSDF